MKKYEYEDDEEDDEEDDDDDDANDYDYDFNDVKNDSNSEGNNESDVQLETNPHCLTLGEEPGVFFGGYEQYGVNSYVGMRQGEEGNICIIGGNGSGKSTGIAKPTLLTWTGAIIATDIKGELSSTYKRLCQVGFAQRDYLIFDPTDPESVSYDPFGMITNEADRFSIIQEIVSCIIKKPPISADLFWVNAERSILTAALLYYEIHGLSFSQSIDMILVQSVSELCKNITLDGDNQIKAILGEISEMKETTLASIVRGLRDSLSLLATDKCINHAFRGHREGAKCFTWKDADKYNIFLKIPGEKVDQWSCAVNLMLTQLIRYLSGRPECYTEHGRDNAPLLLLLDEFPRFGKIEGVANSMSTLRSKKVNFCLFVQSIAQIEKIMENTIDRKCLITASTR